jgi:hypothetical protein
MKTILNLLVFPVCTLAAAALTGTLSLKTIGLTFLTVSSLMMIICAVTYMAEAKGTQEVAIKHRCLRKAGAFLSILILNFWLMDLMEPAMLTGTVAFFKEYGVLLMGAAGWYTLSICAVIILISLSSEKHPSAWVNFILLPLMILSVAFIVFIPTFILATQGYNSIEGYGFAFALSIPQILIGLRKLSNQRRLPKFCLALA